MSEARTIPWETISEWFAKNEQTIRDVMKFEGLRGAVNEILRIAPDQPELDAQRLRADTAEAELKELRVLSADQGLNLKRVKREFDSMKSRAAAAEQRTAEMLEIFDTINCSGIKRVMNDGLVRRMETLVRTMQSEKFRAALNPNPEAQSHE